MRKRAEGGGGGEGKRMAGKRTRQGAIDRRTERRKRRAREEARETIRLLRERVRRGEKEGKEEGGGRGSDLFFPLGRSSSTPTR